MVLNAISVLVFAFVLRVIIKLRTEEFRERMSKKALIGWIICYFWLVKSEADILPVPKPTSLFGELIEIVQEEQQNQVSGSVVKPPIIEKRFNNPKKLTVSLEINNGDECCIYEATAYDFYREGVKDIRGNCNLVKYTLQTVHKMRFATWFPPQLETIRKVKKVKQWSVTADYGYPYFWSYNRISSSVCDQLLGQLSKLGISLSRKVLEECLEPLCNKLRDLYDANNLS